MGKEQERGAGILLPISSIPSPYGIGTLGDKAYEFVDLLVKSGQKYWQVLPVGPTSYGDSPYQSFSAFAGNPYFIDLDYLVGEGLLDRKEITGIKWCNNPEYVEYDVIYRNRFKVLFKAFKRSEHKENADYIRFVENNSDWLLDYALFMAVKADHDNVEWQKWEDDIKFRRKKAVDAYKKKLSVQIDFYMFLQFKFYEQWMALKKYANDRGVRIIGDIPIYVALDSADVWTNPSQFVLDRELKPVNVAGCPPDMFSSYGQKWGNPIYDWKVMEETDFAWWKRRMAASAALYDVIRIDHFIGIVRYYNIPLDKDPADGFYEDGPGIKLIKAIDSVTGNTGVIAEDLGVVIPKVTKLMQKCGYPGMKVIEFAFDGSVDNVYLPHNHGRNYVTYLGTHDNDTLQGYIDTLSRKNMKFLKEYLGIRYKKDAADALIRCAFASTSDTVIIQMQDILKKDTTARMNIPSTLGCNWKWRLCDGEFSEEIVSKLKNLTVLYDRCGIKNYFKREE